MKIMPSISYRIVLLTLVLLVSACASLKKPKEPKISIEAIKVESVNLTRAKIGVDLMIFNPNDYDLHVQDIAYSLFLKDTKVLEDEIVLQANLKALEETAVKIPVFVNVFDAINLIGPFMNTGRNPEFTVKGQIDLENYLLPIKFDKKHTLNLDDPSIRQYFAN